MTINIRNFEQGDFEAWVQLWMKYLDFYGSDFNPEIAQKSFAKMCDEHHLSRQGLVAECDGKVVGFAHVIFHEHNWRLEDVCYLQDLFVEPAARSLGLGGKLIEYAHAQAVAQGASDFYWLTQDHNTGARKLYDQIGQLTSFIKYAKPIVC